MGQAASGSVPLTRLMSVDERASSAMVSAMVTEHGKPPEQRALTKSALVACISREQPQLSDQDVTLAVNSLLECMAAALANGERIEIRGFGSMSLHYRSPRAGRNPKTGEKIAVPEKYVPHFKPGANLRQRVNAASGMRRR